MTGGNFTASTSAPTGMPSTRPTLAAARTMIRIKARASIALVIVVSLRSVSSGDSAPVTSLGIAILCPVATSNSRLLRIGKARQLRAHRSEAHTSELQSLMRISYAVFCLKKKTTITIHNIMTHQTYSTNYTLITHEQHRHRQPQTITHN